MHTEIGKYAVVLVVRCAERYCVLARRGGNQGVSKFQPRGLIIGLSLGNNEVRLSLGGALAGFFEQPEGWLPLLTEKDLEGRDPGMGW